MPPSWHVASPFSTEFGFVLARSELFGRPFMRIDRLELNQYELLCTCKAEAEKHRWRSRNGTTGDECSTRGLQVSFLTLCSSRDLSDTSELFHACNRASNNRSAGSGTLIQSK